MMGLNNNVLVQDTAAALDAISWRLRQRGLWTNTPTVRASKYYAVPTQWSDLRDWAAGLGRLGSLLTFQRDMVTSTDRKWDKIAQRSAFSLRKQRALIVTSIATAGICGAFGAVAWRESGHVIITAPQMTAVPAFSADGMAIGALPRNDVLYSRTADGKAVARITTPSKLGSADFLKAAAHIEGRGVFGVDPINIARAGLCAGASEVGFSNVGMLRQRGSKCAGASTLLQQALRGIDDDRSYSLYRKARHIAGAIGVAVRLNKADEDRFIADHVFFGYAEGQPIYGIANAAKTILGKSIDDEGIELHEAAFLAGLLLHPVSLSCSDQGGDDSRWTQQVDRGLKALKAFEGDPRYSQARIALQNMHPITSPALDKTAKQFGYPVRMACVAGASPLLKLEIMASTAGRAAKQELADLPPSERLQLTIKMSEQVNLVREITTALNQIHVQQHSIWHVAPGEAQIFALRTDATGAIISAYRKSAMSQIDEPLEMGSISKLYALSYLAERGWGARPFCNRAANLNGKQLHNSGGDKGSAICKGKALKTEAEVWGRSLSLAVYDALRQQDQSHLRQRLLEWGVAVEPTSNAAYQVAFGLARSSPRKISAFVSAMSLGTSGLPPVGYLPHALANQRANKRPFVDLSFAFRAPGGRSLIENASTAAFTYRHGTLASLGPVRPGSVGKTATLDDDEGNVRFKGAVGGDAGSTWMILVQPNNGSLGGDRISILPLARAVKGPAK
jgi:hypothetical protein